MKIEVCVASLEAAKRAEQLKADRVELCSEMGVGGVTPSIGLVEQLVEGIQIPIHVLVRPRSGDFNYSTNEFSLILKDMERLIDLNVAGIVVGATTSTGALALPQLKEMLALAGKVPLTFHRAFDVVEKPLFALEQLIDLGFAALLTGGQCERAADCFSLLKQMKSIAADSIDILPGGGVHASNCQMFVDEQFNWLHLSAKKEIPLEVQTDKNLSFLEQPQYELDEERLKTVVALCK